MMVNKSPSGCKNYVSIRHKVTLPYLLFSFIKQAKFSSLKLVPLKHITFQCIGSNPAQADLCVRKFAYICMQGNHDKMVLGEI